jgi:hypothetical protein
MKKGFRHRGKPMG